MSLLALVEESWERWPVFKVHEESGISSESLELTHSGDPRAKNKRSWRPKAQLRPGEGAVGDQENRIPFPKAEDEEFPRVPTPQEQGCNALQPASSSGLRGPGGGVCAQTVGTAFGRSPWH
jgi:hypothetical protein